MINKDINKEQESTVMLNEARFGLGQVIQHSLFDYRGVIVDIDPVFLGTDAWYEQMAKSRPPKNKPWYKILVNNSLQETYVAEQNLVDDPSDEGINHPLLAEYFDVFQDGHYVNNTWRTN